MPKPYEPFVNADAAARFLGIEKLLLLSLACRGIAGSYEVETAQKRKRWVFRLSELGIAIDHRHPRPFPQSSPTNPAVDKTRSAR